MTSGVSIQLEAWDFGADGGIEGKLLAPSHFDQLYLHLYLRLSTASGSHMFTLPIISCRSRNAPSMFVSRALLIFEPFQPEDIIEAIVHFLSGKVFATDEEANSFLEKFLDYEFDYDGLSSGAAEFNQFLRGRNSDPAP